MWALAVGRPNKGRPKMQITIVQGAAKHQLNIAEGDTIRAVKAKLAAVCDVPEEQQRLLVKGKEAADASTVGALGLAEGARLMLLKNAQGHKTAAPSLGALAANNVANNSPAPTAPSAPEHLPAAPAATVGIGSVKVVVTHGKARYELFCESETTVVELKRLLQPLCGAPPAQQRLLIRGKHASERSASLSALGLGSGGKVMLLFGEAHHIQAEHAAAVRDAAIEVPRLAERLAALRRKQEKRLIDSAEILANLASLDELLGALTQDLKNAGMHGPCGEAEEARITRLAELEALSEEVAQERYKLHRGPG